VIAAFATAFYSCGVRVFSSTIFSQLSLYNFFTAAFMHRSYTAITKSLAAALTF
jgi:hypothetical protein